jgi:hypothetical protein
LNFHRPCFFPEIILDEKGRQRRLYRYDSMDTPYRRLKSLPEATTLLMPGVSFENLDKIAFDMTDNLAAQELNTERKSCLP